MAEPPGHLEVEDANRGAKVSGATCVPEVSRLCILEGSREHTCPLELSHPGKMKGGSGVAVEVAMGGEGHLPGEEGWVCSAPAKKGEADGVAHTAQVEQCWPPRKRKPWRAGLLPPTTAGLRHVGWPGGRVGGVERHPHALTFCSSFSPGKESGLARSLPH